MTLILMLTNAHKYTFNEPALLWYWRNIGKQLEGLFLLIISSFSSFSPFGADLLAQTRQKDTFTLLIFVTWSCAETFTDILQKTFHVLTILNVSNYFEVVAIFVLRAHVGCSYEHTEGWDSDTNAFISQADFLHVALRLKSIIYTARRSAPRSRLKL